MTLRLSFVKGGGRRKKKCTDNTRIYYIWMGGESPTYKDTQPVIRAIGVSHTACKYEFRRNLRPRSWSVFLVFYNMDGMSKKRRGNVWFISYLYTLVLPPFRLFTASICCVVINSGRLSVVPCFSFLSFRPVSLFLSNCFFPFWFYLLTHFFFATTNSPLCWIAKSWRYLTQSTNVG